MGAKIKTRAGGSDDKRWELRFRPTAVLPASRERQKLDLMTERIIVREELLLSTYTKSLAKAGHCLLVREGIGREDF